ncbi:MAG TPA: ABC transporter ATP-binding protein [Humisphaera sp.]
MDTPSPDLPPDAVVRAAGLGKRFRIYPKPLGRAVEWLSLGHAKRHDDFWALRDVSFSVARGESLGVIGVNGSGKSTLLKILSGALHPTTGTFDVRGRVLSLLELGTGVNPQLTGRQNVLTASDLLNFPPGYARSKLPEIEAFADLPDGFFDRPVGLYSSGMLVRLVFSMFACFDPDVFVVDEALAVGDVFFQQKCARRLQAMRAAGTTLMFVSHDLAAVEALCDRVMVLHKGEVRHLGDKMAGIRAYYALSGASDPRGGGGKSAGVAGSRSGPVAASPLERPIATNPPRHAATPPQFETAGLPWQPPDTAGLSGDGRVVVTGVCFRRDDGGDAPVVHQGDWLDLFVRYEATADVGPVNCGVALFDRFDRLLFARGWLNAGLEPVWLKAGQACVGRYRLNLDLEPGEYTVTLSAAETLPRADAPGGWDQDVGGAWYAELKRATKVAVLPRADGRRTHYGPSPLRSEVGVEIEEPAAPEVARS